MTETVIYHHHGSTELALDVYRPTANNRRCAILLFHGGGWLMGSKEHLQPRATALAAYGFTAVAVQYRLLDAAPWPAPLADATAALAWTRDNAEALDVEPGNVVLQGHSAGAHIALMTGTREASLRPAAIVAYYPPIGFHDVPPPADAGVPPFPLELDELGRVPSWMLFPGGASAPELAAASPIGLLDADFPPTVIFHGTADTAVNTRSSIALHRRLIELGVPSDLHLYADRDHEFDMAPSMTGAAVNATASFLERFVTDREERAAEARRFGFPPTDLP